MAVWFLLVCKMRCGTADRLRHYPVASASGSQPPLGAQPGAGGPGRSGTGAFPLLSYSFLGTREEFLELLGSVGFTKIDCRNETSEGSERSPGELALGTILGADMPERQANAARSGKEGRLVRMFVIAQRPS